MGLDQYRRGLNPTQASLAQGLLNHMISLSLITFLKTNNNALASNYITQSLSHFPNSLTLYFDQ